MQIDNHAGSTKLLWVDLEMTGLDPAKHVIIEVAAQVTDWDFTVLGTYAAIISHPDDVLNDAHEVAKQMHTANGLFERIRTEGRPEREVVHEFTDFIRAQFGEEPAVLAGNSIHQDRRFIREQWQSVENLLHYRMLDVSAWKLVMQGKYGVQFEKQEHHLASTDIGESIAELQYYLAWLRDVENKG